MKRFFERLPVVWKYDSAFRSMTYVLAAGWVSCFGMLTLTILYPSFLYGLITGMCITYAMTITIRLVKEM